MGDAAVNEKAKLELGREHFAGLKDGSVTGAKAKRQITKLVELGKEFSFDETLLSGFPGAMGTKLEKRTMCDDMFLNAFEAEVDARIAVHETKILEGEPDREKRAAVVLKVRSTHELARQKQIEAAGELEQARRSQREEEAAVSGYRERAATFGPELRRLEEEVEVARRRLAVFQAEPLSSFEKLKSGDPLEPFQSVPSGRPCVGAG